MFTVSVQSILPYVPKTSVIPRRLRLPMELLHLRPQPLGQCEDRWLQFAVSPPSWAVSRTQAVCMKCVRTRLTPLSSVLVALSSSLSRLQGWDRRLRWSFRLVISSFEKTDTRREDWPTQICPSIRPTHPSETGWVATPIVPSSQPGTESNVSKAASPSKQSNIRAILQRSLQLSLFLEKK